MPVHHGFERAVEVARQPEYRPALPVLRQRIVVEQNDGGYRPARLNVRALQRCKAT